MVAVLGSTWLLLVTGIAVGIGFGAAGGDLAGTFARTVVAALAQAPAVWLVTALAVAAYAVRSRWSVAGWVLLVLFLTLGQLGELLRLPRVLVDLSPYVHVPKMPVEPFAPAPALTMTLLAAVVLAAGWSAYRRRRHRLSDCAARAGRIPMRGTFWPPRTAYVVCGEAETLPRMGNRRGPREPPRLAPWS